MKQIMRGQRSKLSELTTSNNIQIGVFVASSAGQMFDLSCFGVDANNKLSDDRYFIFYNQKSSPEGALRILGGQNGDRETFQVDFARLPQTIQKLIFTISLDSPGTMSQISQGYLRIVDGTGEVARFSFSGQDFKEEKAVIVGEFYFKDVWRFVAVGQGFNGGLNDLLKNFGGEETTSEAPPVTPPPTATPPNTPAYQQPTTQPPPYGYQPSVPPPPLPPNYQQPSAPQSKAVSLEKRLEKEAPHLVNLSKTLGVTLEKKGLQNVVANVALVMDASGSMAHAYKKGIVQGVIDRVTLVAARLDDNGSLETWFFASKHQRFPDVTIENVTGYINNNVKSSFLDVVKGLGASNNEPPVMQEVLNTYKGSNLPVLVIFITDGGIYKEKEIKNILIEASRYPIFWQFVGVAGSNYGVLERFDSMSGRVVDNANFFQVDDLTRISDDELYSRLLNEFPTWLREVKSKGMLR